MEQQQSTQPKAVMTILICFLIAFIEGIDLQSAGVAAAGVGAHFGLDKSALGLFFSAAILGLLPGGLIGGRLGDRIGRKKVLMISVALFGLFSILTALVTSYQGLLFARFMTGAGLGAALPNLVALASEAVSEKARGRAISLMYCGMPIGGIAVSLLASSALATDWKVIFYVGGVFRMCDMAGNDIDYMIRKHQLKLNPAKKFSGFADQLFELKRFGQKTQKGWYDYSQGNRRGDVDAEVIALIDAYRAEQGMSPKAFSDDEIVARCIYALANEGFRLLEEGIALRQSDIDVVYLAGYGFPRWRGGPMFYAQQNGLDVMTASMQQFAQDPYTDADFWQVPALLAKAAA